MTSADLELLKPFSLIARSGQTCLIPRDHIDENEERAFIEAQPDLIPIALVWEHDGGFAEGALAFRHSALQQGDSSVWWVSIESGEILEASPYASGICAGVAKRLEALLDHLLMLHAKQDGRRPDLWMKEEAARLTAVISALKG